MSYLSIGHILSLIINQHTQTQDKFNQDIFTQDINTYRWPDTSRSYTQDILTDDTLTQDTLTEDTYTQDTLTEDSLTQDTLTEDTLKLRTRGRSRQEEGKWSRRLIQHLPSCRWEGRAENLHLSSDLI